MAIISYRCIDIWKGAFFPPPEIRSPLLFLSEEWLLGISYERPPLTSQFKVDGSAANIPWWNVSSIQPLSATLSLFGSPQRSPVLRFAHFLCPSAEGHIWEDLCALYLNVVLTQPFLSCFTFPSSHPSHSFIPTRELFLFDQLEVCFKHTCFLLISAR